MAHHIGFFRFVMPFLFLFFGVNFILLSCRQVPKLKNLTEHSGQITWRSTLKFKDKLGQTKKRIYFTMSGLSDTLMLKCRGKMGEGCQKIISMGDSHIRVWYNAKDIFKRGRTVYQLHQNKQVIIDYSDYYKKKKQNKRNLLVIGIIIFLLGGGVLRISRWAIH